MKVVAFLLAANLLLSAPPGDRTKDRILVYTHNGKGVDGKGEVHNSIPAAVAAIRELAASRSIDVEVTDDPGAFNNSNLRRFKAIVFANSNNEAFYTEAQREAFKKFVTEGGGIVGVHSATGSEPMAVLSSGDGWQVQAALEPPEAYDPGRGRESPCHSRFASNFRMGR